MSAVGSIPMHFRQAVSDCHLHGVAGGESNNIQRRKRMFGIGMPELIVILVIVLIIFGAGKLPQIGEGLGKGIRNFKKATKDREEIDATPKKPEEISEKK